MRSRFGNVTSDTMVIVGDRGMTSHKAIAELRELDTADASRFHAAGNGRFNSFSLENGLVDKAGDCGADDWSNPK